MNLDITIKLSPAIEALLLGHANRPVLAAIHGLETKTMSAFTDLKASIESYVAAVEVYKTNVAQKIADAIAADDAGEDVDLNALKAEVDAAAASLNPPDMPPA